MRDLCSTPRIIGRNISLRLVECSDVDFILSLRLDAKKSKFVSPISAEIQRQKEWILEYKKRESLGLEYYFVIESNARLGLVRMYDFKRDSFCWGSFIVQDGAPVSTAMECVCCLYDFAFYGLGFLQSHFDVRKGNSRVVAFHKRFGARIIREDSENYYFNFTLQDYEKIRQKYEKFVPLDVYGFSEFCRKNFGFALKK